MSSNWQASEHPRPVLSEAALQDAEAWFPELAAQAGRAAYQRALQRLRKVVKAQDGRLVEARADGTVPQWLTATSLWQSFQPGSSDS